jgi:hypothetical protein
MPPGGERSAGFSHSLSLEATAARLPTRRWRGVANLAFFFSRGQGGRVVGEVILQKAGNEVVAVVVVRPHSQFD